MPGEVSGRAPQAEAAPAAEAPPAFTAIEVPRTGVEILGTDQRKGVKYHVMRDLRNGNVVKNVTRSSRGCGTTPSQKESDPSTPARSNGMGHRALEAV